MKTVWIAMAAVVSTAAFAQATIYKHVDENGHTTYTNRPMKGAVAMDLEPITLVPGLPAEKVARVLPANAPASAPSATPVNAVTLPIEPPKVGRPIVPAKLEVVSPEPKAVALPLPRQALASVEPSMQRRRDEDRRKILEEELRGEEQSLTAVRASVVEERANPTLVAAVRAMQQADNPTPSQMVELRGNVDKASGRIRGLQATAAEHEKNIEAIKKELGALKP
jgi:hypothetical protein